MDLQDCQLFLIPRALLYNEEAGKKDIIRVNWSGQALSLPIVGQVCSTCLNQLFSIILFLHTVVLL